MINRNNLIVGLFAFVILSVSLASAAVDFTPSSITGTVRQGDTFTTTFNAFNDDSDTNLTGITSVLQSLTSSSNSLSTSVQSLTGVPPIIQNKTNSSSITYTVNIPSSQATGTYSGVLKINGTYSSSVSYSLPITLTVTSSATGTFCSDEFSGEAGNLKIDDVNIENLGEGDEETWNLLDEITIDVDVQNRGNDNIDDIVVEVKIVNSNGNDVTNDFDFDDKTIDLGRIKEDDTETATFKIAEVPADVETEDYKLYFIAYEEGNEDKECASVVDGDNFIEFNVESQYDEPAVIPKGGDVSSLITAQPGETRNVVFDVYNLGDQDEEDVLVVMENQELGIRQTATFKNLDIGEKKAVDFSFVVPEDANPGRYDLEVTTYFDYDEGSVTDVLSYDSNSFDDLDENFGINLDVIASQEVQPTIDASLGSSEVKIGEPLIIQATITNNGASGNFVFSATGFESWADLTSVSPQTATIAKGQSSEVLITLVPKTSGLQSFRVNAIANGETFTQSVSVNIPAGSDILSDLNSPVVYLVGAIVVLVVIILLVLIIRLARGPKRKVSDY